MKKVYAALLCLIGTAIWAQSPGLLISEFLQNPGGSDSPFEYVELIATEDIDFSVTPYTVIVSNNGSATANGWIEGGSRTYAFEITAGTISIGDVVYVGGTSMAPTGTVLRAIDTGTDGGDGGIGNSSSGGVLGNGGGNADGIAVFNLPVASITASTVPTDVVFYGTGLGSAVLSSTDGYELAVNDLYDGGKLEGADFFALDADLTIATGVFDLGTNTFSTARTFASGAGTDGISDITFIGGSLPMLSFTVEDSTVNEDAGVLTFEVEIEESNATPTSADIVVRAASTADSPEDFVLVDTTISFPASATGTMSFSVEIIDDMIEEQTEYIIITIDSLENAELDGDDQFFLYIKDNDRYIPTATNELAFELLTSFSTGTEGESSAEIVAYDSTSYRLFVANSEANNIDIIDFADPAAPVILSSFNVDSIGAINSVASYNNLVAVAIEAPVKQDPGFVLFMDNEGNWLNKLQVGVLPDMVTFNHAGTQLIAACEGEPNDDYTVDPLGGISIIDITGPVADLTVADVTNLDFTAFDALEADLKAEGVRIFGPSATVSQDLEPEGITVMENDSIAWVTLQENNAIARINIETKEITDVLPLGTIDHSVFGHGLDASNQTSGINIANFPINGMFQPDMISHFEVGGEAFLITANEGDARDYDGFSEEERVKDLDLDSLTFLDRDFLQNSLLLGRLKTTSATGDTDGDGDIDEIHTYGTRSFTIWDEATGEIVFDSGDLFELIIANDPEFVNIFNASNGDGSVSVKNRSDDKGPEPEGITAATIDGNAYVFVSLERVGGVFAFNVNDPYEPMYIGYHNNRDAATNGPDRGAEGILYIDAEGSPNGNSLLILANEVSSTLSIYEINSCSELSGLMVSTAGDENTFCEGDSLELVSTTTGTLDYQWQMEGEDIDGATEENYYATEEGIYQLTFANEDEECWGITDSVEVFELAAPSPEIDVVDAVLWTGSFETYQWYFEGTAIDGATEMSYTPEEDGEYTVVVTSEDGCEGEAVIEVSFTSISENGTSAFNIYPNPAKGQVFVEVNQAGTDALMVKLLNVVGETVMVKNTAAQANSKVAFDLNGISAGIYFIEVSFEEEKRSMKLIVE
ncbi:MAG: choice-of-anchor I family protein [Flavobacteriales bacterium]|nr:choice-of-anchor I family protein [Flavobacteriales bacterium]